MNNSMCIKYYIMSGFPKLGFVMELQGIHEFHEKLLKEHCVSSAISNRY